MTEQAVKTNRLTLARWIALAVGIAGLVACAWGLWGQGDRVHFFRGYLFAWTECLEFAMGGLSVLMLHNATGGTWGRALRVVAERASLTLPLVALMFVPVLFGLRELYPWANPAEVAAHDVLQHRAPYLNVPFFVIRTAAYFAIWIALAFVLRAWQRRFEETGDATLRGRIRGLSAAGIIIYVVTMTNAGIDWLMSRDVDYYSTAFGFVLTTGQTLAGMAFAIIVASLVLKRGERRSILAASTGHGVLNDMGNVVLTMVILWTYVSFMEFLVIWMGNSREDNTWFLQRGLQTHNPWGWVGLVLILWHFFIPFYVLLFRGAKQYVPALVAIAWLLATSELVNGYWLVAPSGPGHAPNFEFHWLDLAALAGLGGIWLATVLWLLPAEWHLTSMLIHPKEAAEVLHE